MCGAGSCELLTGGLGCGLAAALIGRMREPGTGLRLPEGTLPRDLWDGENDGEKEINILKLAIWAEERRFAGPFDACCMFEMGKRKGYWARMVICAPMVKSTTQK